MMTATVHLAQVVVAMVAAPLERGTGMKDEAAGDAPALAAGRPAVAAPHPGLQTAEVAPEAEAALLLMIEETDVAVGVGAIVDAVTEVLGPKPTQLTTILI